MGGKVEVSVGIENRVFWTIKLSIVFEYFVIAVFNDLLFRTPRAELVISIVKHVLFYAFLENIILDVIEISHLLEYIPLECQLRVWIIKLGELIPPALIPKVRNAKFRLEKGIQIDVK